MFAQKSTSSTQSGNLKCGQTGASSLHPTRFKRDNFYFEGERFLFPVRVILFTLATASWQVFADTPSVLQISTAGEQQPASNQSKLKVVSTVNLFVTSFIWWLSETIRQLFVNCFHSDPELPEGHWPVSRPGWLAVNLSAASSNGLPTSQRKRIFPCRPVVRPLCLRSKLTLL